MVERFTGGSGSLRAYAIRDHLTENASTRHKRSFHEQTREEWLGDLGGRGRLLVRKFDGDKFFLTVPAMPKVLDFPRVDALIPFEADQLGTALRAFLVTA